jgi:[acyl-carrier-protein] S-malonyltransferase
LTNYQKSLRETRNKISAGKSIFLYPGQGSQKVGIGSDLYQSHAKARDLFDQADHILGFSLSRLCFEGPEEELQKDFNAQLAVYTLSCIITQVLRLHKVLPGIVSGYSSGFYAAAYAAGCFSFGAGLELVKKAGEILLDEGAKIDGAMAVIFGLPSENVARICEQVRDVEVAIRHTSTQNIISGIGSSVKKATELSLGEGAINAYVLPAATSYHSSFMKQSSIRLLREIEGIKLMNPRIPLVSYLSLKTVRNKTELRDIMAKQLSGPVLWVDLIRKLSSHYGGPFVEVGPGEAISRAVRWIDRNIEIVSTETNEKVLGVIKRSRVL